FEYRPRSVIPVALAASVATAVHMALAGTAPVFAMPELSQPTGAALSFYVLLGALVGVASVGVTRAVYAVEDGFEKLPIHWMWWPALGGLAVGGVGYLAPHTMGVGYDNIEQIVGGHMLPRAVVVLCSLKFVSWAVSLGSGTSGGTLAPLFTLGGGLGSALGALTVAWLPSLGVDVRIAALVGMAAMFAGASRALLASVVFAFETTRQPLGLLPLLGGCTASFLVSCLLMKNSIMTEKIARRGIKVLGEYSIDFLDQLRLREHAVRSVVTVRADDTLEVVRRWLEAAAPGSTHQGFPVLDASGRVLGVVTRKDLYSAVEPQLSVRELLRRPCIALYDDGSFRDAANCMARQKIGRLPVLSRESDRLVGIITRSDLVEAHVTRLEAQERHGGAKASA
ncbi:MAG: chloride channel protein, partial [Myxococcaceae bacterium]|nr:chloride channel protein [Myxococcaceae bacterium]